MFEATVDGAQKILIKNENPQTFENVKIYAAYKHEATADAEIKNFKACHIEEGLVFVFKYYFFNNLCYSN